MFDLEIELVSRHRICDRQNIRFGEHSIFDLEIVIRSADRLIRSRDTNWVCTGSALIGYLFDAFLFV